MYLLDLARFLRWVENTKLNEAIGALEFKPRREYVSFKEAAAPAAVTWAEVERLNAFVKHTDQDDLRTIVCRKWSTCDIIHKKL